MPKAGNNPEIFRFGPFALSVETGELRKQGRRLSLSGQPIEVLTLLVKSPGGLVTREELQRRLWPGSGFGDFESGLNAAVNRLRDRLGDSATEPKYIETIPGRGYRFIAALDSQNIPPEPEFHKPPCWRRKTTIAVAVSIAIAGLLYPRLEPRAENLWKMHRLQQLTAVPLTALHGHVISPSFSPDASQIAFAWDGESNGAGYDLYVKVVGTDKAVRLTHHPVHWLSVEWSPDGSSIAMSRIAALEDSGIYLIAPTGGPERKLTSRSNFGQNVKDLAWSPDGKYLAFTDHQAGSSWERSLQLYVLSLDTLERNPLKTDCSLVMTPAYSPRGDILAWSCVDSWSSFSVHALRLRNSTVTKIVDGADGIGGMAWSGNGRHLLFSSPLDFGDLREAALDQPLAPEKLLVGHDASDIDISRDGHRLAYVQGIANINIWRVDGLDSTPRARKLVASSREQKAPSISPDGSRIAFESNRAGINELWICDSDGTGAVQLSHFGLRATGTPRWSPDGKLIAFDSRAGGEANLYVIDSNGGAPRKVEIDTRGNNLPSWSRDGKWLYFVNGEDSHHPTIWKVPLEGGHAIQLMQFEATYPVESPDGRALYFVRNQKLWRANTDGSVPQEVAGMPRLKPLAEKWVVGDGGIYFLADQNGAAELCFFDLAKATVRHLLVLDKTTPNWMGEMALSSDGTWLLFAQLDDSSSNIMMIENWR